MAAAAAAHPSGPGRRTRPGTAGSGARSRTRGTNVRSGGCPASVRGRCRMPAFWRDRSSEPRPCRPPGLGAGKAAGGPFRPPAGTILPRPPPQTPGAAAGPAPAPAAPAWRVPCRSGALAGHGPRAGQDRNVPSGPCRQSPASGGAHFPKEQFRPMPPRPRGPGPARRPAGGGRDRP